MLAFDVYSISFWGFFFVLLLIRFALFVISTLASCSGTCSSGSFSNLEWNQIRKFSRFSPIPFLLSVLFSRIDGLQAWNGISIEFKLPIRYSVWVYIYRYFRYLNILDTTLSPCPCFLAETMSGLELKSTP